MGGCAIAGEKDKMTANEILTCLSDVESGFERIANDEESVKNEAKADPSKTRNIMTTPMYY